MYAMVNCHQEALREIHKVVHEFASFFEPVVHATYMGEAIIFY